MKWAQTVVAVLILVALFSCQTSKAQVVKVGEYRLEISTNPTPPKVGDNDLKLVIFKKDQPVINAKITVSASMPAMGTMAAMKADTTLQEKGMGSYEGTINIPMDATWDVVIHVIDGDSKSNFSFKLIPNKELINANETGTNAASSNNEATDIKVPDFRRQLIGVTTQPVNKQSLTRTIRAVGRVEIDQTKLWNVTLKFSGWIHKLFVNYAGAFVEKGAPLLQIYSQELYATQNEFLNLLNNARPSQSLVNVTRERLKLWDLSDSQIDEIAQTKKPIQYMTIYSPATGIVIDKTAVEGMQIEIGKPLYQIADLSKVWVIADIYEYEANLVRPGQKVLVSLPYSSGETLDGVIDYVYPQINTMTRTLPVRIVFKNYQNELKPGMFVNANVDVFLGQQLAVPEMAILYSGDHRYVFIDKGEGNLEPREVKLGTKANDFYVVLDSLQEDDKVVTSGTFLISSEARLKGALPKWENKEKAK